MTSMVDTFDVIPVVSMAQWRESGADQSAFARELVDVLHRVGFLALSDHGIDEALINRHFAMLEAFFDLPEETKATIDKRKSPHFRGWERIGAELTDNKVDYREQLDLSTENPTYPGDAVPAYLRLDGPNQWLAEGELPGFRDTVTEYFAATAELADELMEVIAVGLGLPRDTFAKAFGERPLSLAKLISYPKSPDGEAGVNAHNDAGFLTVLMQHGVSGLQVVNPQGEWIDVPPIANTYVINIGEMLQSMTGNYLVATKHRVISPDKRYSTAYFHGPDLRASIEPLSLGQEFTDAVAASPRHSSAGFMAKRDELLAGDGGTQSAPVRIYGDMLWNYYVRSYPEVVRAHYPDLVE